MAVNYFVRDDAGYCECGNYLLTPKEQNDQQCWGCKQDEVERAEHTNDDEKRFLIDDESVVTLAELHEANPDDPDIAMLSGLSIGDRVVVGGGAAAEFSIVRVADETRELVRSLRTVWE